MEAISARRHNPETVGLWTRRITECKNSGKLTGDWCTENGINIKTNYYWHNKIHKMVVQQQSTFYEVPQQPAENLNKPAATIRIAEMQADISRCRCRDDTCNLRSTKKMLSGFRAGKIYLATGYTDLRRGIDGLAGMIQEQFQLDAFDDTLFLFCGRRNDRIKGLYWDSNGFLLLYKRLEKGRFQWPRTEQEAKQITHAIFAYYLTRFELEVTNPLAEKVYSVYEANTPEEFDAYKLYEKVSDYFFPFCISAYDIMGINCLEGFKSYTWPIFFTALPDDSICNVKGFNINVVYENFYQLLFFFGCKFLDENRAMLEPEYLKHDKTLYKELIDD